MTLIFSFTVLASSMAVIKSFFNFEFYLQGLHPGHCRHNLGLLSKVLRGDVKALTQHLKEGTRSQKKKKKKKKKKKEKEKMNLHKYLNELVKMTTYNLVGKGAENTFISSAVKVSCTCASATSALSQTLDD